MDKAYEPKKYEDSIYKKWEESKAFKADVNSGKPPFTISMPPPNATGVLHLGHSIMLALQDILIRHRRMKGYEVLWVPGTDHAGIATQNRVEKLIAEEGLTREQLGREGFLHRVTEFVAGSQDTIRNQVRKMGASCDWSRERYTLDDNLKEAVTEMFVRMYKDELVYRGYRIVNWCPRCQSTLADDEVQHEDIEGNFYYIEYPFKEEVGGLIIATTRPETMLGDTAVAVNPNDERYAKYIGKKIIIPLINREIEIIGDEYVDLETGTGALKVTPAHDPNDFEIGKRHNLETLRIMDAEGKITNSNSEYDGLDRIAARNEIVENLKKEGFLKKVEPHGHSVGHCYRCNTMIEPLTSDQWFIDVNKKFKFDDSKLKFGKNEASLKELSLHVVKEKHINIVPERFDKTYFHWMENLRDWCVSRQIWWGHRIPVWYCDDCEEIIVSKEAPSCCSKCKSNNLRQDEDTLDTWFSSGLWTFSTLGWPNNTEDLAKFHPTSVMETGYDILFFWIARMILMTTYALNDVPFDTVYLHGLIRTREGKKMSKSDPSTCIDPLYIIDQYGADALRMSMVVGNTPGNDMRLYEEKIKGYRNFTNKLWNASRFVLGIIEEKGITEAPKINYDALSSADEWILNKLNAVIKYSDNGLMTFKIGEVGQELYDFFWNDFCDWYLELSKGEKQNPAVLYHVLKNSLILLHPFMPFVTEEIWSYLPGTKEMLIYEKYSEADDKNYNSELTERAIDVISSIRKVRAENKIEPVKKVPAIIYGHKHLEAIEHHKEDIMRLARIDQLTLENEGEKITGAASDVINGIEIFIPLDGLVDTEKEKARLEKEIKNIGGYIKGIEAKLSNKKFVSNAPDSVVDGEKKKLDEGKDKLNKMKEQLGNL